MLCGSLLTNDGDPDLEPRCQGSRAVLRTRRVGLEDDLHDVNLSLERVSGGLPGFDHADEVADDP